MSLESDVKALARLPIFSAFEPEALKLIAFAAEPVKFGAGDVLFRNGEVSDAGFLILSGSIMLDLGHGTMDNGKIVGPGALIGELALLAPTVHPSTAIARENATTLKLPRSLIRRVLEEFPESARRAREALRQEIEKFGDELDKARRAL
ncbi:cyclic nucleotide-binding domain-containing protein [Rhodoblastus sp.]|jgi:CRP-like cAMP-binding protein|uniref:cyclic nucleotide-binding domain-containing protein n=1 Tax=Rhodoblastus sp. TaxID=1962975 RepID=UPI0025F9B09E|nr:cyclic nucleotide-binding domain-containing protein [Rhodoblastus sp.]